MKIFCCYCGKHITPPLILTNEHLIPLSRGGNNSKKNKRSCCINCNKWRSNLSLKSFKSEVLKHFNNNIPKDGYSKYDFEIMIYNIDWVEEYVLNNKNLLRSEGYKTETYSKKTLVVKQYY